MRIECPACHYVKSYEYDFETRTRLEVGDEEFLDIRGNFTIEKPGCWYGSDTFRVSLRSCPKCNCVVMVG